MSIWNYARQKKRMQSLLFQPALTVENVSILRAAGWQRMEDKQKAVQLRDCRRSRHSFELTSYFTWGNLLVTQCLISEMGLIIDGSDYKA
jgi:hypothetical protein